MRSFFFFKAAPRFELGMKALQAPALPLGHAAITLLYFQQYRSYIKWSGRRDSHDIQEIFDFVE